MGSHPDTQLSEPFKEKLIAATAEVFDFSAKDFRLDLPLGEIEGWDSMNAVNLTLELESAFSVSLEGIILTADQTFADVVAILEEKGATA
jgi:acyl carrier protein